ncbi:MAG: TlpA family protein disulfide reductase [Planctomycetes bacterium]|nr:TlpA family protein disulfide reductase [Planctomycetota bacterium]MBL7144648.1 TlpA family protein disulfide reductase [Phycisphaerae bacterium]
MKAKKLFCLLLVPIFIIGGCKKNKTEPAQQTKAETEIKPAQPIADSTPSTTGGKPAPAFALQDLNGKNVSLADLRGKVVVLDFWATWCPPCVKEIPHFVELHEQYKDKGVEIVGISLDQAGVSVVKAFVQKYQIKYPIMMTDGKIDKAFGGILSIPTTFLIDSAGNITKKYVGYNDKAVFEADIKKLLPEAK